MTDEDRHIRNVLLRVPTRHLTARQQAFVVRMVQMEHAINSRTESIALAAIAMDLDILFEDYPRDPGPPESYNGVLLVVPEPNVARVGGPGGVRPDGAGDANDVPERAAR